MYSFFLYILFFLLTLLLLLLVILFLLYVLGPLVNGVPFVSVPQKILPKTEEVFGINNSSIVYDLGCGDARVLLYLAKKNSKAKYIGIENNQLAVILAKIGAWFYRRKNHCQIVILNQNFFKKDLSLATHIFLYLYPEIMDKLLPKLEKELKPGAIVVSATFKFTNKRYEKKVILEEKEKNNLVKKIYVYKF